MVVREFESGTSWRLGGGIRFFVGNVLVVNFCGFLYFFRVLECQGETCLRDLRRIRGKRDGHGWKL